MANRSRLSYLHPSPVGPLQKVFWHSAPVHVTHCSTRPRERHRSCGAFVAVSNCGVEGTLDQLDKVLKGHVPGIPCLRKLKIRH